MNTNLLKNGFAVAGAIISSIFTVVPEEAFKCGMFDSDWSDTAIIISNRVFVCIAVLTLSIIACYLYHCIRCSISINNKTYAIKVEYKNLIKAKKGKKIINFDECFSTNVGSKPEDIKPESICGQYLLLNPNIDLQRLISEAGVQPAGESKYKSKDAYTPGTIVPNDKFLLTAFAKLDKKGKGYLTYEEYLDCLNVLWEQIDCYHGTDDVYVPILGSGITRLGKDLSQQELLDIMIASYSVSPYKIKKPKVLHIVCKRQDGFSLNDVFGVN